MSVRYQLVKMQIILELQLHGNFLIEFCIGMHLNVVRLWSVSMLITYGPNSIFAYLFIL